MIDKVGVVAMIICMYMELANHHSIICSWVVAVTHLIIR